MMKQRLFAFAGLCLLISIPLASCQQGLQSADHSKKTVVVTYSILGSVVKDLAGDSANVVVLMPNGADPHEWEPSAKDIETLNRADLIVQNGIELEGGMQKTLEKAKGSGVKFFTASEHITIRRVGAGEGIPSGDPDQAIGAEDPHLWTDPLIMKDVVAALASQLKSDLAIDVDSRSSDLQTRLVSLNDEISAMASTLPQENRKLVTGHESMGYFAQRYGFKLVGAIIPSITTEAEVSASDLVALKKLIEENNVKAIFTELGTSPAVANAIGKETGVKVLELTTHSLPADGSYFTFERNMAKVIVDGLK
jgi:zinc/manganese transport system substrate-binding protein